MPAPRRDLNEILKERYGRRPHQQSAVNRATCPARSPAKVGSASKEDAGFAASDFIRITGLGSFAIPRLQNLALRERFSRRYST
jgi:hypothetical protein